ncbi:uncharacterized protein LOC122255443 isoform X1 [Penaeus japonicus]|uniref:uncharacterized protein LOC122255443 isoform X1 n=1 Tax=Penaeus japonicus TaxID=27405 RepID=UPI001C7159C7|nr:uncharacterized protein LOC122255443 isoform X1 [Penaeus japonicus]
MVIEIKLLFPVDSSIFRQRCLRLTSKDAPCMVPKWVLCPRKDRDVNHHDYQGPIRNRRTEDLHVGATVSRSRKAMTILALSISLGVSGLGFTGDSLNFFCGGTLVASLVVSPLLLTTLLFDSQLTQKMLFEIKVNFTLASLMVVLGGLIIHNYSVQPGRSSPAADAGKAVGSMCLINSLFYGLDTFFAYQNYRCV